MTTIEIYVADDGKEFYCKEECEKYEVFLRDGGFGYYITESGVRAQLPTDTDEAIDKLNMWCTKYVYINTKYFEIIKKKASNFYNFNRTYFDDGKEYFSFVWDEKREAYINM